MARKSKRDVLAIARDVILQEAAAVGALADRLGPMFEEAVNLIYRCEGRVVVTGMGKSGQISRKIAATLTSTQRKPAWRSGNAGGVGPPADRLQQW